MFFSTCFRWLSMVSPRFSQRSSWLFGGSKVVLGRSSVFRPLPEPQATPQAELQSFLGALRLGSRGLKRSMHASCRPLISLFRGINSSRTPFSTHRYASSTHSRPFKVDPLRSQHSIIYALALRHAATSQLGVAVSDMQHLVHEERRARQLQFTMVLASAGRVFRSLSSALMVAEPHSGGTRSARSCSTMEYMMLL